MSFLRRQFSSFSTDLAISIAIALLMIGTMVLSSMIFSTNDPELNLGTFGYRHFQKAISLDNNE